VCIGQEYPELKELVEVVHTEILLKVDFSHPRVVMHSLGNHPILTLGDVKDQRSMPRSMPKMCLFPISDGDFGGCVKYFHILLVARIAGSRPNFSWVFPLLPRPT
jgi:hypothetical protein